MFDGLFIVPSSSGSGTPGVFLNWWTHKIKASCSFKTLGSTCPKTQCHIPADLNLKSYFILDKLPPNHTGLMWCAEGFETLCAILKWEWCGRHCMLVTFEQCNIFTWSLIQMTCQSVVSKNMGWCVNLPSKCKVVVSSSYCCPAIWYT